MKKHYDAIIIDGDDAGLMCAWQANSEHLRCLHCHELRFETDLYWLRTYIFMAETQLRDHDDASFDRTAFQVV